MRALLDDWMARPADAGDVLLEGEVLHVEDALSHLAERFAVAAHLETEILFVDEVLSVGDLHFRNRCLGRMQDLRDEGRRGHRDPLGVRRQRQLDILRRSARADDDVDRSADAVRRWAGHCAPGSARSSPARG